MLDLTPFGFTPTESSAYEALLQLGPSSGYSVAKSLAIARANAYQALDGLVTKGAAVVARTEPKAYRAVSPSGLQALIGQRQAQQLERLEEALGQLTQVGAPSFQEFSSMREFVQLTLRAATRAKGQVRFLGTATAAVAVAPIWRKRDREGLTTEIWVYGDLPKLPVTPAGTVPENPFREQFGAPPIALTAGPIGVLGTAEGDDMRGYWSSEQLIIGCVNALITSVAGSRDRN